MPQARHRGIIPQATGGRVYAHCLPFRVEAGLPAPLGATLRDGGVNFSLFSPHATAVQLLLFEEYDQSQPSQVITLDPRLNATYYYWHALCPASATASYMPIACTDPIT